jgi:enoyl-CoA hydratase/carnithine racemase
MENREYLIVERPSTHVLLIRLNRPKALNALSKALLIELAGILSLAETDEEVRCVVLTGDDRAFSAGADIKEMPEGGIPMWGEKGRLLSWKTIERFNKPLVAAVNGWALGGGCELVTLCDIAIAGENARFGSPEVKIAAFSGDGGTQRIPRLIGRTRAMFMQLTGDPIDAATACAWGLVVEVTPTENTVARAVEIAETIAKWSPIATQMIKEEIRMNDRMPLDESLSLERKMLLWQTEDHDEGIAAFVEKREPDFKGR